MFNFSQSGLKKQLSLATVAAFMVGVAACGQNTETTQTPSTETTPSEETGTTETGEASGEGAASNLKGLDVRVNGAGASFPAPLYQRWFSEINGEYPGVQVAYQSVGSGAGVEQYLNRTVDFGATDAPLTDEERQQFQEQTGAEPIQIPMTAGSVVFAYNLPQVEGLQLPRDAYCGIVSGEITNWNDPTIVEANPDAQLPDQPINFVHRSDGSGTTYLFTSHIAEACPNWQGGAAKSVDWPVGTGAKGNEGVAAQIQQTEGSIGYVEYAYANENDIPAAAIENAAGNIIEPTPEAASLVFDDAEIPEDFALTIPDPQGEEVYPIAGLTWLLIYPQYDDASKAQAIEGIVDWSLNNGDKFAEELGYIPLPESLKERVQETVEQEIQG